MNNLKNEIRQLRERVDELEQTTDDSMLLDYISETSKHVVNLEHQKEVEKKDGC